MSGTVVVTGAAGFIGSGIVRALTRSMDANERSSTDGDTIDRVVAVLRPGSAHLRLEEPLGTGRCTIERIDLHDRTGVLRLIESARPRVVIHAALDRASYGEMSNEKRHETAIAPMEALLEGLAEIPAGRFIHTGSAWVLRAGDQLDEAAPTCPLSPYALTKAMQDEALPRLAKARGVAWMNLRLFNTFGAHEGPNRLIPYLVSRLTESKVAELSQGNQIRDFNDVDSVGRAFLLALQAGEGAWDRLYHIGSGRSTRLRDFALTVAQSLGRPDLLRFGAESTPDQDISCLVAQPALAREQIGWTATGDRDDQIRKAVQWWIDRAPPRPIFDRVPTTGTTA